jgi:CDC6, C terminal.
LELTEIVEGGVVDRYTKLCESSTGSAARTRRRVTDYLDDLNLLGIIDVESRTGGDGSTRIITLQKL